MKIGILTQPLHTNYGGLLQNYALQQVLKRMGHDVKTIRHDDPDNKSTYEKWKGWLKYSVLHRLHPDKFNKPSFVISDRDKSIIRKKTEGFIDKHIDCTPMIDSHEGFTCLKDAGFDAFVVGSDQCWRPKYNRTFLYEMFLSFLPEDKEVIRLAYAASFGTEEWEMNEEQTQVCAKLAKHFSAVSVREDSGIQLCKDYLGVNSTHVLDPTLLLDKDDYLDLLEEEQEEIPPRSLFTYILDPSNDICKFINTMVDKTGLSPIDILPKSPNAFNISFQKEKCVFPSLAYWLKAIVESEMTIVDSFHGMVFSIIFNKPFWVIGNHDRGMSRFYSLLKMFGMEDRLLQANDYEKIDFMKPIDWDKVNSILEKKRAESIDYLLTNLAH